MHHHMIDNTCSCRSSVRDHLGGFCIFPKDIKCQWSFTFINVFNSHGVIGTEDDEIVKPTLESLQQNKKLVYGPYAADSFFGTEAYKKFDGVLAMYHDQGLAPFKALSFGNGVNFTAGLEKIRTSPDHGTAYEIAGKGIADNNSFKQALFSGISIYKTRTEYLELTKNKLKVRTVK